MRKKNKISLILDGGDPDFTIKLLFFFFPPFSDMLLLSANVPLLGFFDHVSFYVTVNRNFVLKGN